MSGSGFHQAELIVKIPYKEPRQHTAVITSNDFHRQHGAPGFALDGAADITIIHFLLHPGHSIYQQRQQPRLMAP